MQKSDEPACLLVGTEISAKFKGAFCEAKVKKLSKLVRCKVIYKAAPFGTATWEHLRIKSTDGKDDAALVMGAEVLVPPAHSTDSSKTPKLVLATIQHVKDASTYVVVFNDGDERTLRRSQLCLKSGKHFDVNLDAMPLTNPELFGSPVQLDEPTVSKKRGWPADSDETSSCEDECLDSESTASEHASEAAVKHTDYGRAVCVYEDDRQGGSADSGPAVPGSRVRPKWYPAMIVHPSAQSAVKPAGRHNTLVRSFADAKYYAVKSRCCAAFSAHRARQCLTTLSHSMRPTIEKALAYAEHNSLPVHWNRDLMLGKLGDHSANTDSNQDEYSDTDSEAEYSAEERDVFVAQLYKYQDERATPINRAPVLGGKDLNLFRLYRVVQKLGGFSRVCTTSTWKVVLKKMHLDGCPGANQTTIKHCYQRYLLQFDSFYRQLGWRMTNETGQGKRMSRGFKAHAQMRERHNSNASSSGKAPVVRPKAGAKTPEAKAKTPEAKAKTPEAKAKTPEAKAKTPEAKAKTPEAKAKTPGPEAKAKEKTPVADANTPELTGEPAAHQSSTRSPTITEEVESFNCYRKGQLVRSLYVSGAFKRWYDAKILRIEIKIKDGNRDNANLSRFFVHYCGWKSRFDEWLPPSKIRVCEPGEQAVPKPAKTPKDEPLLSQTPTTSTQQQHGKSASPKPAGKCERSGRKARRLAPAAKQLAAEEDTDSADEKDSCTAEQRPPTVTVVKRKSKTPDIKVESTASKAPELKVQHKNGTPELKVEAKSKTPELKTESKSKTPELKTLEKLPERERQKSSTPASAADIAANRKMSAPPPEPTPPTVPERPSSVQSASAPRRWRVGSPSPSERQRRLSGSSGVGGWQRRHSNDTANKDRSRSSSRSSSRLNSNGNGSNSGSSNGAGRVTRSKAAAEPSLVRQWSRGNVLMLEEEGAKQRPQQPQADEPEPRHSDDDAEDYPQKRQVEEDGGAEDDVVVADAEQLITVSCTQTPPDAAEADSDLVRAKTEPPEEEQPDNEEADDDPPAANASPSHACRSRRRRRKYSSHWPDRKTPKKEQTGHGAEVTQSPRHCLNELKQRLQSSMSNEDVENTLTPFNLPHIPAEDDGRSRLSAMESRLTEIRDAYADVKNELLRLERTWKRTQEKRLRREERESSKESGSAPASSSQPVA